MRLLLAGAWHRRGLNAACLLVAVLSVAASVLGPMYARESAEHLLDSRVDARAPYLTGLSFSVPAMPRDPPRGSPARYRPPDPMALVRRAERVEDGPGVAAYWKRPVRWVLDRGGRLTFHRNRFNVPLYWRQGMCRMARVSGRCPRKPGEVLVQQTMAQRLGVGPGWTVTLTFTDHYLGRVRMPSGRRFEVDQERPRTQRFQVVGTYRIADPTSPRWFDLARFTGLDHLDPPPESMRRVGDPHHPVDPPAPALLTVPATMTSQTFEGGVDRPIDPAAVDLDTLRATQRAADAFALRVQDTATVEDGGRLDLRTIFADVRMEQVLLSRVVLAALVPLVVLALLLLHALVWAGAAARRPDVSLARLRGHSRRQVLWFAVAEPWLVVAVGVPVGAVLGVAGARLIARIWLHPGIPVVVGLPAWTALATVAVSTLVASALAGQAVINEPLAEALKTSVRPRRVSRVALVLRGAVVAVAVAALVQLLTSPDQSSQLLALLAPLLLALAVSVLGAVLLQRVGRWWAQRTAGSGGVPSFLAARRLARREDLTRLLVPMVVATSILGFSVSTAATSDDWRESRARADVGAPVAYQAAVTPRRLLWLTRRLDPSGRHLAAVTVDDSGDGTARRVFVDASRLAAVSAWDPSWSDVPVRTLARRLTDGLGPRLSFRGSRLSVALADVRLGSATHSKSELWVQYVDDQGEERNVSLGSVRNGPRSTLTSTVFGCAKSCEVDQLYLSGVGQSVSDVDGTLTLRGVSVDGRPVDWGLRRGNGWRPARPFPVSLVDPPVVLDPRADGLHLRVFLGRLPPGAGGAATMVSGVARITPATTPDVAPVVLTDATAAAPARRAGSGTAIGYPADVVVGTGLSGAQMPVRVVARSRALPLLGNVGELGDLETSLVEFEPPGGAVVVVELWTSAGTPPAMLARVRDAGVALTPLGSLEDRLHALRTDAFSVGLRLFLLVGLATVLFAVLGVLALAVLASQWLGYEVASLRVVGVPRRSLVRASLMEHLVALGFAVGLGLASAALSVRLVLPAMSLGPAGPHEPAPAYLMPWAPFTLAGVALLAVSAVVAVAVSGRTTRLGKPDSLRWSDPA